MGIVGIDEAGKGPVVGAMVVAAVRVPDSRVLPEGLVESKQIQPAERETIANQLRTIDTTRITTEFIEPEEIDDPSANMNTLTVAAHGRTAAAIIEPNDIVITDAADTDQERFARRLRAELPHPVSLTAEHKADENHDITAAASIIAKVTRDAHVATLESTYGEIGSGYPSDPKTMNFLAEYIAQNDELPPIARKSWATSQKLLAQHTQNQLTDY
jgi:ribonuclease HII